MCVCDRRQVSGAYGRSNKNSRNEGQSSTYVCSAELTERWMFTKCVYMNLDPNCVEELIGWIKFSTPSKPVWLKRMVYAMLLFESCKNGCVTCCKSWNTTPATTRCESLA